MHCLIKKKPESIIEVGSRSPTLNFAATLLMSVTAMKRADALGT